MREIEPAPLVLIQAADPYQLQELVRRERARRAMIPRTDVVEVRPGLWAIEVVQLRPMRRPWVKPVAVSAAALSTLSAAGLLGWWLFSLAVVAGITLGTVLVVCVLAWLGSSVALSGTGSGCETTVTIRHRH